MKRTKSKPKAKKPRRVVLGEMDLSGIGRGNGKCQCFEHQVYHRFPALPFRHIRLVAEVLK